MARARPAYLAPTMVIGAILPFSSSAVGMGTAMVVVVSGEDVKDYNIICMKVILSIKF